MELQSNIVHYHFLLSKVREAALNPRSVLKTHLKARQSRTYEANLVSQKALLKIMLKSFEIVACVARETSLQQVALY